jgi:hypothetical protein
MPRAINQTKGTVVAQEVRFARSIWSRFLGLMGQRSLPEGQALLLEPCSSIHCMFMRFPIDVIFLDREGRVVKVAPGVRPWRMAAAKGARSALELPAGLAARSQTEAGDKIIIEGP